jgi:hypothetical protein
MSELSRADWMAACVIAVLSVLLVYGLQHAGRPRLPGVSVQGVGE